MMKRMTALLLAVLMTLTVCGCSQQAAKAPEIGKWHAECRLSDLDDVSLSDEDRALYAMLTGDVGFGIDVEFFEDGSFAYDIDTQEMQSAISDSVSTIIGWFMDFDVSVFVDHLIEAAMNDVLKAFKSSYLGDYTKSEDGMITAVDGDILLFKIKANRLIQIDENGNEVFTFTRVNG